MTNSPTGRRQTGESRPVKLRRRHGMSFFAAVTALSLLSGATAAYAVWSAITSVSSTASTATVTVGHALSGSTLAVTYSSATSAAAGVVTITNTGTRDGTYSLAISATSASSTLRAAVDVAVGTTASCTTTATLTSPVTGTFAATVTKTGSLASGASVALCVKTSMSTSNMSANPAATLAATISSSITIGTWSATASPAITFNQTVAASATIETGPYYWIKRFQVSPERCAEADSYGTTSGTAIMTGQCGTAAQATSNTNEFWRFVPTTGGYFRIVNRNAPTLWWSVPSAAALQPLQITAAATTAQEWLPALNANGSYSFKLRANTALCAESTGNGNGASTRVNTCVAGSVVQEFIVEKLYTITPAPITLACSSDGSNSVYTWALLTGYEAEVTYRVLVGATVDTVHTGGTGSDPNARFAWVPTTAAYPAGTYTVTVQSQVANSAWYTVGTATLKRNSSAPWLACS